MIRVMVVEDEGASAERYASLINAFGHGFRVASVCRRVPEAIDEFRKSPPDVVLSDIRMGRENGLAMLEEFRRSGWNGHAVIVSGYNDFAYAQKAIHLQAFEYLLKPVFLEDMNRTLRRLLTRFEEQEGGIEAALLGRGRRSLPPFVARALAFVALRYTDHVSLHDAADYACVSPAYLSTSFRRYCGCTFVGYLRRYRMEVAKRLLESGDLPIDEVAVQVGICDVAYFNKLFKRVERITPGRFRKLARGGQEGA